MAAGVSVGLVYGFVALFVPIGLEDGFVLCVGIFVASIDFSRSLDSSVLQ